MPHIERTITVPGGDLDSVWAYLADYTTTEEWDPPTKSTRRVEGDGGIGTTYLNVSTFLWKETEATYTVVAHEPPRRLELEGEASSMGLHDTITVEQDGADVVVRYRAEFHPQGAAKLVGAPGGPHGAGRLRCPADGGVPASALLPVLLSAAQDR